MGIADFYYSADRQWDNNFDRAQAAYDAMEPPDPEEDLEDEDPEDEDGE